MFHSARCNYWKINCTPCIVKSITLTHTSLLFVIMNYFIGSANYKGIIFCKIPAYYIPS